MISQLFLDVKKLQPKKNTDDGFSNDSDQQWRGEGFGGYSKLFQ